MVIRESIAKFEYPSEKLSLDKTSTADLRRKNRESKCPLKREMLNLGALCAFACRPFCGKLVKTSQGTSVNQANAKTVVMPLGVVIRRTPGVTPWAKWSWRAVAVLPGAAEADWSLLREEGEASEFHAATLPLELHRADAEAYMQGLTANPPSIYVVMRPGADARPEVALVTASPFEAQDYADTGEDQVEKVDMPAGLVAWVRDFTLAHFKEEEFKKRRRDRQRVDFEEEGVGDARIPQLSDVYRAPVKARKERLQ